MQFEKVLHGIMKYINKEIAPSLNDWQSMLMRVAMARILGNKENIKKMLTENPFIKTFAIIDADGDVDVSGLMKDIKGEIEYSGGNFEFTLPLFGTFNFSAADVDRLHAIINMEGHGHEGG